MRLLPQETDLIGRWIFRNGKMEADDVCARIEFLTASCLRNVAAGGWETLYQDPADGRYWEKTYPQSAMHGGGPPRLRYLPEQQANLKYKLPQQKGDRTVFRQI
jgi:hypothetical protein